MKKRVTADFLEGTYIEPLLLKGLEETFPCSAKSKELGKDAAFFMIAALQSGA